MCWASTLCCQSPLTRRRAQRRTHPAGGTVFWVTSLRRPVFGRKRWRKTREMSASTACRLTKLNKTAFARGVAFFTASPAWYPRGVSCPRVDTFSLRSPRGPRGDFLSPRGYPRPRGVGTVPVPVPVAPCPSLQTPGPVDEFLTVDSRFDGPARDGGPGGTWNCGYIVCDRVRTPCLPMDAGLYES
jgi:hypothetical protein